MLLRTIEQAHKELLERDAECALTMSALRRLVTTGKIPATMIGRKYLLDVETLPENLAKLTSVPAPQEQEITNGIRRLY